MENLFKEFKSFSAKDWQDKLAKDLAGATLDDLSWVSAESIKVKPFYTQADLQRSLGLQSLKHQPANSIKVQINHRNIKQAKKLIQDSISNDCHVLGIDLNYNENGIAGLPIHTAADFISIFDDVDFKIKQLDINCIGSEQNIVNYLNELIKSKSLSAQDIKGSVQFDPYSQLLTQDKINYKMENQFDRYADFISGLSSYSQLKTVVISGTHFHAASANIIEEIAYTLATLIDYFDALSQSNISIDEISKKLSLKISIGSNFFFEIAKIRALKAMLAQVLTDFGISNISDAIHIQAESSSLNKSLHDGHTNLLRLSTESMIAQIAGVDSICLSSFDHHSAQGNEFSQRLSRNIQHLLNQESHLNLVNDAAAGSYYIESLTEDIIEKSWATLHDVESKGGFFKMIESGSIQNTLAANKQAQIKAFTENKKIMVGVNKFQSESKSEQLQEVNTTYVDNSLQQTFYNNPIQQLDCTPLSLILEAN